MKFPKSEGLGIAKGPDGQSYEMEFYGEEEGAAAITGPWSHGLGEIETVPTIHYEPAIDANDAFAKLTAWTNAHGWPQWERQKERVIWTAPTAAEQAANLRDRREKR